MLFFMKRNVTPLQKSIFNPHSTFIFKLYFIKAVNIMKKILQGVLLPFAIFSAGILLIGCEQNQSPETTTEHNTTELSQDLNSSSEVHENLKSGNVFYVVRDVADMQMKAGTYIDQLKQTQISLENAVNTKDHQQLKATATQLHTQLKELNQVLESLNLKSHEVDNIRANILSANEKVLSTPFLNGDVDLSKIDLTQIEQQMGSVQNEMIKLASMIMSSDEKKSS